ncbi:hypothetical protein F2Q69_00041651 [Brassica cretica]|uniref:Uncharacterized protein n=1 Tax=Brassica cretica TaxID=69181 RepID=A0A8S9NKM7_BRACR|nr:hypothetical protein F2Q69_00041651 [Brassica cretica]
MISSQERQRFFNSEKWKTEVYGDEVLIIVQGTALSHADTLHHLSLFLAIGIQCSITIESIVHVCHSPDWCKYADRCSFHVLIDSVYTDGTIEIVLDKSMLFFLDEDMQRKLLYPLEKSFQFRSFLYSQQDPVHVSIQREGRSPLQRLDEILEDPMTTQDRVRREIDGRCNRDGDYDLEANNIKTRDW